MTSYLALASVAVGTSSHANGNNVVSLAGNNEPVHPLASSVTPLSMEELERRRSSQPLSSPSHSYVNSFHNYINSPIYNGSCSNTSHVEGQSSRPVTSCSLPTTGVTDINTNYAKLDDLVRYYVNINTPVSSSTSGLVRIDRPSIEGDQIRLNQMAVSKKSLTSTETGHQTSTSTGSIKPIMSPRGAASSSSSSHFQFPPLSSSAQNNMTLPTTSVTSRLEGSPVLTRTPSDKDPVNYIMLDLDNTSSEAKTHFVSTCPATPVSKTPKGADNMWQIPPETTPIPGTPTSVGSSSGNGGPRLPYAMIDFDKTEALTSTANQRK